MMTWMTISLMRPILLLQSVKGEFGAIQIRRNKQEFQQWTAGLDRESVREALLHFQALNEQHEREDHARQAEALERASAS